MTHETAREKLLDLAYGELTGREARRVEAHLHECEACRAELATIRETRGLMSALGEAPAPAHGEAELLAAARAAAEGLRRPSLLALPPWFLGASAGAVALFVVGAVSYRLLAAAPARRDDPEALLGAPSAPEQHALGSAAQRDQETTAEPGSEAPERGQGTPHLGETAAAERRTPPPTPQKASRAAPPAADQPATAAAPTPQAGPPPARRERAAVPSPGAGEERSLAAPAIGIAGAPADARHRSEEETAGRAPAVEAPALRPAPFTAGSGSLRPEDATASASTRSAAPRAAPAVAEGDVVERWRALRGAGQLRGEVVTFLDCPGEAWRKVETDPQGRVIRYVRHGLAGGVPFEAELFYAEDGALGAARYREAHGAWRELRLHGAGAGPAIPAPALDPVHASEAAADAPPRCRF